MYFCFFLCPASTATAPASLVANAERDGARMSGHVASNTSTFPHCHGTKVVPSGLFPSDHLAPGDREPLLLLMSI